MRKLTKIALSISLLGLGVNVVTPSVQADSFDDFDKELARKKAEFEKQYNEEVAKIMLEFRNDQNKIKYQLEKDRALSQILSDEENKIWNEKLGFSSGIKIGPINGDSYLNGGILYFSEKDQQAVKAELENRTANIKAEFEKNYPKFIEEQPASSVTQATTEKVKSEPRSNEETLKKESKPETPEEQVYTPTPEIPSVEEKTIKPASKEEKVQSQVTNPENNKMAEIKDNKSVVKGQGKKEVVTPEVENNAKHSKSIAQVTKSTVKKNTVTPVTKATSKTLPKTSAVK